MIVLVCDVCGSENIRFEKENYNRYSYVICNDCNNCDTAENMQYKEVKEQNIHENLDNV